MNIVQKMCPHCGGIEFSGLREQGERSSFRWLQADHLAAEVMQAAENQRLAVVLPYLSPVLEAPTSSTRSFLA